jgi:DNA-binding NarL/FixJ family response regulator
LGQFFLPLAGRSEVSKEKEKKKDNAFETQRMVCRSQGSFHPGQFWLQMSAKEVFYYFSRFAWPCCRVLPLVLCVTQRLLRFRKLLENVFHNEAAEALMALALQVVSSHLLGALDIERALSVQKVLVKLLLPHGASDAETLKRSNCPRLFLLDGCSLNLPLGPLSGRLRANSPGSKFLALLPPDKSTESEMMLLFYWGIDGFVTLHKKWKTELRKAALAILRGGLWVPSEVLLAFVKQMKTLLDTQLAVGQSLTARESQVLQLLFRRLTNKDIAYQLNISERTAKFHVSNVLSKLGFEKRRNLLVSASVNG